MPDHAPQAEAREFAAAFRGFIEWVHQAADEGQHNEVAALIAGYLGPGGANQSVVSRDLPAFEHVNLQTAIDAWSALPGRAVEVHGILLPPHHMITLQQLAGAEWGGRLRLTAPALVDLPNGPASTLGCLKLALLLVTDARGRYVIMVQGPGEHHPGLEVEIAGLPDAVLTRVERHALGVAAHRAALLAAGQHLKRGLLLYGPPGTGKTHTTRYLLGQMTGYTRLVLTGRALIGVGAVTELARDLQPAVVVLEDVDLVAEDRSHGPASSPVLFDLLDAMDGAAPDADLLFLLTTNRADLLEPALAARPGRVDVAARSRSRACTWPARSTTCSTPLRG